MVVLSAIGRFFKKIWDWIKQTAWIQPLLIVGIIFGVIFSIPSIVKAVRAANEKKGSADVYYLNYQYSIEGGENSEAGHLLNKIMNPNGSTDKFFLTFVKENDSKCSNIKGGFQVLEEEFGNGVFKPVDSSEHFKLITIYIDQETSQTTDEKSAFTLFMDAYEDFFFEASARAFNTGFYDKGKLNENDLNNMAMVESIPTPTIMLVDLSLSQAEIDKGYLPGVTEVIFNSVDGSNDYDKARTLIDCWNHEGVFDINSTDK